MARPRSKNSLHKETPQAAPVSKVTSGFYKKSGDALYFAPTAVHFPGGSEILVAKHNEYEYPVNGWTYYESAEDAYAAEGLEMPAPATPQSIAERIAARKAITPEQREAERAQRDAERIARLQSTHPEKAAKLQARLTQRAALASMSPEERKAARSAALVKSDPEVVEKVKTRRPRKARKTSTPDS